MAVGSYVELYTLMIGWHLYNVFWNVIVGTGIVFLPFVSILYVHWHEAYTAADDGQSSSSAQRAIEWHFYIAIFILVLVCIPNPLTAINRSAVHYTPPATRAEPNPAIATGAQPRSTFAGPFGPSPAQVNLPPWWYTVLAISNGINHAIVAGIDLPLEDMRGVAEAAKVAKIDDSHLRHEIRRFAEECHLPARSAYFSRPKTAQDNATLAVYGADDPDWLGSHLFLNDPELYPNMYSSTRVPGFPFDPERDRDMVGARVLPTWGRPTCLEWWLGGGNTGLRDRILAAADATSDLRQLVDVHATALSEEQKADVVVKTLLDKTGLRVMPLSYDPENTSIISSAANASAAKIGSMISGFMTWLAIGVLKPSLPFVQAIVLMGISMLLAPYMVITGYSFSGMYLGALAILTVKLWSVFWYITDMLDDRLILAIYPDANSLMAALTSLFEVGDSTKAMLLNIVLMSMYLGLPALWTGMMSMAGVRIGAAITDAQRQTVKSAASVGDTAAGVGRAAAMFGGRFAGSAARNMASVLRNIRRR